jgi:hypothetical protein
VPDNEATFAATSFMIIAVGKILCGKEGSKQDDGDDRL